MIYLDGIPAGVADDHPREPQEILPAARGVLKPGATITIAVHLQGTPSRYDPELSLEMATVAWPTTGH